MAEEQPAKKKRLVRNPETFRERAVKATEESDKPTRTERARGLPAYLGGPIVRPVGSIFRRLFQIQPFKFIGLIFKWIGKILVPPYIRQSWRELRLVTWPDRKKSRQLTVAVLIFAIVFGALVALLDFGLDKIFKQLLLK